MNQHAASLARWAGTLCSLLTLLCAHVATAQNVAVLPGRIVLDGSTRTATAFVTNHGDAEGTFRVSLSYWRMDELGQLVEADSLAATSDNFAGPVVRYSPRRMVIPPGSSQTLRLMVRRPPGLEATDWEYHAHLSIQSVPAVPNLKEVADPEIPIEEDAVVTRPIVSVETLVPVIVRIGRPDAKLEVTRTSLIAGAEQPTVRVEIARLGQSSVYGDMIVDYVSADGIRTRLIDSGGVAIYTDIPRRLLDVDFARWPHLDPHAGKLEIDYRTDKRTSNEILLSEVISLADLKGR